MFSQTKNFYRMETSFKRYTATELYIPIAELNAHNTNPDNTQALLGFRPTGGAFFDSFMTNLCSKGIRNARFHADLLGISYPELCTCIKVLTGSMYNEFVEEFTLLKAMDLLQNQSPKLEKRYIASLLGFTYAGFYHFMVRKKKWYKAAS